ncbi:hypothetical protein [Duganella vulcania]|uniref:Uncharacterized protein n=1 Tax=Duganella vulcania TaxID=2692166 RepID=A0A845GFV6_9BURK|nr:hypothetical protein [Duganella vulcania]MYM92390.1 hypothetical protein [Duganella vulcania]
MRNPLRGVIRSFVVLLLLALSNSPVMAAAEIVAQSGYRAGEDGLLLLSTACLADKTGQLRHAVRRLGGQVVEGCYVINKRGNAIIKWSDGSLVEVSASVFDVKTLPQPESKQGNAWLLGSGGKDKCSRLQGTVDEEFDRIMQRWAGHTEVLSPPHNSNGQRFFQVITTDVAGRQYSFLVTDSRKFCVAADVPADNTK